MKHLLIVFTLVCCLGLNAAAQIRLPKVKSPKVETGKSTSPTPDPAPKATSSTASNTSAHLLKRTIQVTPRRFLRWWKNPTAAEPVYDTWSWVPEFKFAINGPVESRSQLFVDVSTADGKPWLELRMRTPTLEADRWELVEDVENYNFDQLEKKAITAPTGAFPFRIRLKNALSGADTVLFNGKFKISTYAPDPKIPEYRGKKEFYIDEDWRLPMAWLWLNPQNNETAPILCSQVWFRGSDDSDNIEAFVFYNGKQIDKSKSGVPEQTLTNGVNEKPRRYSLRMFYFYKVRGFNRDANPSVYRDSFFLDRNPGTYEIKVLRNGELARVMSFTVGSDGKIADNNIVQQNKIGGIRLLMPIKIVGAADGTWNTSAWQTDAFYGNPLAGFSMAL
jgi:hypothetical protein